MVTVNLEPILGGAEDTLDWMTVCQCALFDSLLKSDTFVQGDKVFFHRQMAPAHD